MFASERDGGRVPARGGCGPGVEEAKAIAEEAYVYGLPLVMNYAVMYDFAVNRDSGQFKAPFNQISNEARVFTYEDTAVIVPNSDTPVLDGVAGPPRGADGAVGAGRGEEPLLLRAAL